MSVTGAATVRGACPHDCPDTCAWLVDVQDGRALRVRGDPAHPFTRGALCSKLKRFPARVYSPERVLHPLRRAGPKGSGQFTRVSWDTALAEITARLREVVARDGPLAAMPYSFAGTIGLLQRTAGEPFFARLGATGLVRDICGTVAYSGVAATIGLVDGVLPEDLAHSRLVLVWGTNPVATNLHLWSSVLRHARAAGTRVIVIDPLRTETAAQADAHVQPLPGTDAALALGMMHVIVRDGLHDRAFIEAHTVGFPALEARLREYPPDVAAALTGVPAATIEALARDYATTRPAAIRLSVGMERHANGGAMMRAVACLPGLVNGWKERGGGICQFTSALFRGALNYAAVAAPKTFPAPSRSVHLAQLGRALTDPAMDPPIRWLMIYNSNPAVTAPHQDLVRSGLAREDLFTVVHEQFLTDTASFADYVLPATTQLEHLDLMPSWGQPYLALNLPAIAPQGEAIPNTELFRRLARAMGFDDPILHQEDEDMVRGLLASGSPLLDGITLERLRDTGWARLNLPDDWRPLAGGRFPTPSGKLEFYSDTLAQRGLDPLPGHEPPAEGDDAARYPLRLMTAKHAHFLNSEYVNLRHRGNEDARPVAGVHPEDAAARGISDGCPVRLFNARGAVEVFAAIDASLPRGLVSLPFNWWPRNSLNGSSANALTPDGLSTWGLGSDAFDARVELCPCD
ncbi:MAG: molybdopterin-dependent oxidoreductase [Gammaproteobacteria bacterium]